MIDASFVEAIQRDHRTEILTVVGKEYASKPVFNPPLPEEPQPETLCLHTLFGLTDYVQNALGRDVLKADQLIVHIESPWNVKLYSGLRGVNRLRDCYVQTECECKFRFNSFMSHAEFMIGLQVNFQDYGDRGRILQAVGTLRDEAIKTSRDDGTTQLVTIAAGIALNQEAALPNPVLLRPYRTFKEVPQPPSSFILRLQPSGKGLPQVALFEVDSDQWVTEAIGNIYEFLQKLAGTGAVILR